MPLTFEHLFPPVRDGVDATYTLKEIHKALILDGYEVTYDQVSEAQRELHRRPSTREIVGHIDIDGQRAYEFTWQGACRIARKVAGGRLSQKQKMQAEAIEHLHKMGAVMEYRGAVDMELIRQNAEIIRLLHLLVRLSGGDPAAPDKPE
ncbi:MAG TPA: hypothetical protein VGB77_21570 [Abditibacteriaceae bacterium]